MYIYIYIWKSGAESIANSSGHGRRSRSGCRHEELHMHALHIGTYCTHVYRYIYIHSERERDLMYTLWYVDRERREAKICTHHESVHRHNEVTTLRTVPVIKA